MATLEQWKTKIASFIQSNVYEDDDATMHAYLYGIAAVMVELEAALEEHIRQTYIIDAQDAYLNEHGWERSEERRGDPNYIYSYRIRNLLNSTNLPALKALIDAILVQGEATLSEDWAGGLYFNREAFLSRAELFAFTGIINAFSITIDKQIPDPMSFWSREYFCNIDLFCGTNESELAIFQAIIDIVDREKALGVAYRIFERI